MAKPKPDPQQNLETKKDQISDELRANYWLKRLDHTLSHTQIGSRLIYIVDGALLASLYFSIKTIGVSRQAILFVASPTLLLLGILNLLHARLIKIQHSWYSGIDTKLMQLLDVEKVEHTKNRSWMASTHGIYATVHRSLAFVLLLITLLMIFYGIGCFPELKLKATTN